MHKLSVVFDRLSDQQLSNLCYNCEYVFTILLGSMAKSRHVVNDLSGEDILDLVGKKVKKSTRVV